MRCSVIRALFILLSLIGCTSNIEFKTLSSAEGGFSLNIPALPIEKTTEQQTPYGTLVEHDFTSTYDGIGYGATYIKIPDDLYSELRKEQTPSGI